MTRVTLWGLAAIGLLIVAGQALAAPATGVGRLDQVGRFVVAGGICDKAGYRVDKAGLDGALRRTYADAAAGGMSDDDFLQAFKLALGREQALFAADADAISDALDKDLTTPGYRAAAQASALRYANNVLARCRDAAADSVFGKVVSPPSVPMSEDDMRDGLMADYGQASFQPLEGLKQGDLLYTVGLCRSLLPAADIRRYQGAVLDGPDPVDPAGLKLRRWYRAQFQDGLDRAGKLTREDCLEILPNLQSDIQKLKGR